MTEHEWGPAMAALTELQRRYVQAMAADPFGTPTSWARAAGYSDVAEGAKVRGHFLSHSLKIEAAIHEFARQTMFREGPMLAVAGLIRIARDENHPKNLQALDSLADRVGYPRTTEHRVDVQHRDLTGAALLERIAALAAKHGIDAGTLIGPNTALPAPVDVQYSEVKDVGQVSDGAIPDAGDRERAEHLQEGRPPGDGAGQSGSD